MRPLAELEVPPLNIMLMVATLAQRKRNRETTRAIEEAMRPLEDFARYLHKRWTEGDEREKRLVALTEEGDEREKRLLALTEEAKRADAQVVQLTEDLAEMTRVLVRLQKVTLVAAGASVVIAVVAIIISA